MNLAYPPLLVVVAVGPTVFTAYGSTASKIFFHCSSTVALSVMLLRSVTGDIALY